MFSDKARAYPSEPPFRYSTNRARLLALPTNIRLGWKSFPGTNTLAYYKNSYIMYGLRPNVKNIFCP
jgi:hypothetical protein